MSSWRLSGHFSCITFLTSLQIDFEKLAGLSGYTVGSAKVTFGKVKRKIKALQPGAEGSIVVTPKKGRAPAAATPKTPKTGTKRAAANADSPAPKKARATPKGRGKKAVHGQAPTNDDEPMPVIQTQEATEVKKEDVYVKHEPVEDATYGDRTTPAASLFGGDSQDRGVTDSPF